MGAAVHADYHVRNDPWAGLFRRKGNRQSVHISRRRQSGDAKFHVYGVIWSENKMQFYRDDYKKPFFTVTPADIPAGTEWAYNHPFFLLLNLAIGGNFPKPGPDNTTPSPAIVLVDYVRIYQQSAAPTSSNDHHN